MNLRTLTPSKVKFGEISFEVVSNRCGHRNVGVVLNCDQFILGAGPAQFGVVAGLGIAIVNDFKSIEGDRELGLKSLPVEFGIDTAKWITVGTIDLTQLAVAAYVYQGLGERWYSIAIQLLLIPQVFFQFKYFIPDPVKNDVKYQGAAQPFLVLGILMTGLAVGHHNQILAGL